MHLKFFSFCFLIAGLSGSVRAATLADYNADFSGTSAPVGWQYLWNAPSDWNGTSATDGSTGAFGNPANYVPLSWNGASWTADGDANNGNGAPANYLRLTSLGGHPGRGTSQGEVFSLTVPNSLDRYAIAAYTLLPGDLPLGSGHVFLTGSSVGVAHSSGTVRVDLHVNGGPVKNSVTVPGASSQSVDRYLGNLNVGDTIYFGVGPSGADGNDSFTLGFQVADAPTGGTTYLMANFRSDYQDGTLPENWRYLWNAPSDWNGTSSSDGSTGNITSVADFEPLLPIANSWRVDGDTNSANGSPGRFLQLTATGGHPGRGASDPEAGNLNPQNSQERYTITAYDILFDGYYAIADSFFSTVDAAGNGNNVRVFTGSNPSFPVLDTVFAAGILDGNFDTAIGPLSAGDTIYVAVGANGTDGNDSYLIDFSIMYQVPEPSSLALLGLGCFALLRLRRSRI